MRSVSHVNCGMMANLSFASPRSFSRSTGHRRGDHFIWATLISLQSDIHGHQVQVGLFITLPLGEGGHIITHCGGWQDGQGCIASHTPRLTRLAPLHVPACRIHLGAWPVSTVHLTGVHCVLILLDCVV